MSVEMGGECSMCSGEERCSRKD